MGSNILKLQIAVLIQLQKLYMIPAEELGSYLAKRSAISPPQKKSILKVK